MDKPPLFPEPSPPLTTQQLWRELSALKELLISKIEGIDKAITVAHDDLVRVPTEVMKQVGNLKELHDEKISQNLKRLDGVDKRFELVDQSLEKLTRFDTETAQIAKSAVDGLNNFKEFALAMQAKQEKEVASAFAAANAQSAEQNRSSAQAMNKSETAVAKQIDGLATQLQAMTKTFDDKISDVKDRLTRIEGSGAGIDKAQESRQTSHVNIASIISLVIGGLGLIAGVTIAALRP